MYKIILSHRIPLINNIKNGSKFPQLYNKATIKKMLNYKA